MTFNWVFTRIWDGGRFVAPQIRCNKAQLSSVHAILHRLKDGRGRDFVKSIPPITDETTEEDEAPYYTWHLEKTDFRVELHLSEDLAEYLRWPRIQEIHHGDVIMRIRRPMIQRQSASLMLEGIEMSHFEGTQMKPYLESLRLLRRSNNDLYFTLGGTAEGRAWDGKAWEKRWMQPITAPI
jgi:hypothetical protein